MARKISFADTLEDASRVKAVWETLPVFKMRDIGLSEFVGIHQEARASIDAYLNKKIELKGLKHARDNKVRDLSNLLTRFRSAMKGQFGSDSVQYAQADGTRSSTRKPRKRKSKSAS